MVRRGQFFSQQYKVKRATLTKGTHTVSAKALSFGVLKRLFGFKTKKDACYSWRARGKPYRHFLGLRGTPKERKQALQALNNAQILLNHSWLMRFNKLVFYNCFTGGKFLKKSIILYFLLFSFPDKCSFIKSFYKINFVLLPS